ncbi:hypothetical protein P6144_00360 [Sphingomonas sp. HITSZ_GF]|uniref:hypothetical protein n=1 Tax=Sphingomonas sp. HITSZ_GF TaxID=3037247 RepID=UPI00240DD3A5|nr:hypothetical protein [Sphingomonas sp. HITSZ_GF]MDG2532088.1 hypothetical protein [Sphingomonas sp. HITSZ_GF]
MQGTVAGAQRSITTSSALNPTLVLALICTPSFLVAAHWAQGWTQVALVVAALAPLILAIIQISYFTLTDPDRLQNEKHVEAKMALSQLAVRDGDQIKQVTIENGNLGTNPALRDGTQ